MKRIPRAIGLAVMAFSLSLLAAGLAIAGSLDDQFLQAVQKGDAEAVSQLLAKGANIDTKGQGGFTALIAASAMGHVDVVKVLLAKGASIDLKDDRRDTALHYAVMIANLEEVKLLLNQAASVNVQEEGGLTPLMLSIVSGSMDIVKLLLDKGANVEARDKNGFTALMAASGGGLIDMVKLLLAKGARIDAQSNDGTTERPRSSWRSATTSLRWRRYSGRRARSEPFTRAACLRSCSNPRSTSYSVLSACIGSIEAARRAGIQLAARATRITTAELPAKVIGSVGLTP